MSRGGVADSVYRSLRAAILQGEFQPSDLLREQAVSDRYHVSRTPVREALKRLEAESLVSRTTSGLVVATLTPEETLELYVLREVLEGLAARLTAERGSDSLLLQLDLLTKTTDEEAGKGLTAGLVQQYTQFHSLVWQGSGNRRLFRIAEDLQSALHRFQTTTLTHPGRLDEALQEHRELLAAIRTRDGSRAEEVARAHMRRARDVRIIQIVSATTGGPRPVAPV